MVGTEGEEAVKLHYLAGPMRGIKSFNYPAFDEAAAELRNLGYEIKNPTEFDSPGARYKAMQSKDGALINGEVAGKTWGEILGRDVTILSDECEGIILLPGWEKSEGARLECFCAIGRGYDCYFWFPKYKMLNLVPDKMVLLLMTNEINGEPTPTDARRSIARTVSTGTKEEHTWFTSVELCTCKSDPEITCVLHVHREWEADLE